MSSDEPTGLVSANVLLETLARWVNARPDIHTRLANRALGVRCDELWLTEHGSEESDHVDVVPLLLGHHGARLCCAVARANVGVHLLAEAGAARCSQSGATTG